MKLAPKILTASLLPFLIIIGLYHFLGTRAFSNHLVDVFHNQADSHLSQTETDILSFFRTNQEHLKLLATVSPPSQDNPVETKSRVNSFLQHQEPFFRVSAVNVNGREWLRISKFSMPQEDKNGITNLFTSPIYQRPMLDRTPYLGNINRIDDFPLPFLDISIPITDRRSGDITGILWGRLSFQGIQTLLERLVPPQGKIMLIEATTGEILVQADTTKDDFSSLENEVIRNILQHGDTKGWLEKSLAKEKATFIFRQFAVNDLDFLLVYYQPNRVIYFLADQLATYNLSLILAGICLFILTSFLLINRITTPLTAVTKRISALGRRYCSRAHPDQPETPLSATGDEVEELHNAFSLFQTRLSSYSLEIEGFNQTLEHQVAEKTAELRKHQNHLEKLVEDRTEELSRANATLQAEIKERIDAQQTAAEEKERLAVTLRSIADGVITTDIKGRVLLMNKVAEELTGWPLAKAQGKFLDEIFYAEDENRQRYENPIESIVQSGRVRRMAMVSPRILVAADGTRRRIDDSGAPIRDKDSRIIGVVLVFRDITEFNRMEEELAKTRKLESVGVLAGGIAHDFNNILASIMGNISFAAALVPKGDKVSKLLHEAEKAAIRAKDLTLQLLTFSKGGEPIKEISSITEVIKDSAEFILRGSNVRCAYTIPEDLWPAVIDKGQISQVIQNIIINANHAMPDGGVIDITCENRLVTDDNLLPIGSGPYVIISIMDKGHGITTSQLDRIFDPYFTTKQKGSGLGLAITHSIVRKHNGHIKVESEPGKGTTFIIYLPATPRQQAVAAAPEEISHQVMTQGQGRILIMDDEPTVLKIAEEMLAYFGHEVLVAQDGAEALKIYQQQLLSQHPIDLVFMDLTVPGGMGGKEAIVKLLEMDSTAKVVVSSGYSNDPIMADFRKYGFIGVINKPFSLKELYRVTHQALVTDREAGTAPEIPA